METAQTLRTEFFKCCTALPKVKKNRLFFFFFSFVISNDYGEMGRGLPGPKQMMYLVPDSSKQIVLT